jgi:hypothetical protein
MVPQTEDEVSVSLRCAWMDTHGAKIEVHSKVDGNFDETNTTSCIDGTSDRLTDGDGYRPGNGCTL